MAPLSPRRSSRARGTGVSQSQATSSTSSLSSRGERNTRSMHKTTSTKSTPTASLSSEPLDDFDDSLLPRRRTRGQDDIRDKIRADPYNMPNDDEIQEDDESVRCVCGFDEYPGPPPFEDDAKGGKPNPEADFFASIELSDEVSGLFVQCDVCKVWQHGACVGIFTEESSPDEYFCENCRKDLHKIHTAMNGQRYSNYLPLGRPSRNTSRATSVVRDAAPRSSSKEPTARSVRAGSANHPSKRRSTMNSRDAAYDEEEQLRRAIEASKEQASPEEPDLPSRRAKRGRSDSQENLSNLKRQRTGSPSLSPPESKNLAVEDDSEEDSAARNGVKKVRAARSTREKSEREERDRQRAENASKRKGRADRRRADDSDPSEETPVTTARSIVKPSTEPQATIEPTPSSAPTPDPTPTAPGPPGSTHKKTARSHHKRGKGRNQYTKERDDTDGSPARSMSRDTARQPEEQNGGGGTKSAADHSGKQSRGKATLHSKVSMSDMKRRVAAFLDFISKTQIEMAGESSSGSRGSQNSSGHQSPRAGPEVHVNGATSGKESVDGEAANGTSSDKPGEHTFKDLSCVEMMDVLTRDLVKWQNHYSH